MTPPASPQPLAPLLAPRTVALVGASQRANSPGHDMVRMLLRGGFRGVAYAINPNYATIEGMPCVPTLRDLPAAPDLAVLSVRNERLEEALAEAIAVGARAAVIFASGMLAADRDPPLAQRLAAMASTARLPICGGNCMGFYNDLDRVWICGFPSPREPRPGAIALIAHSGSVFGALAHNDPRLAFALAISPGQELTTTVADYIDYALERPEVKVIGLFLETARDPLRFRAALAKAAERNVPVVALKLGRTAAAATAALSHTGALAGSDVAWNALFDHYGVVRVDTLDELACTLLLLAAGRRAAPGALVSIHDSGGECEMFIDLAERVGVPFAPLAGATKRALVERLDPGLVASNPLDAWGTGVDFEARFGECFAAMVADEGAALGVFAADVRDRYYLSDGFAAAAIATAATTTKPVAFVTHYTQLRHDAVAMRLTQAGVPVLDGTYPALVAIRGALAIRDFQSRDPDPLPGVPPEAARDGARAQLAKGTIDEATGLAVLAAWGVPVVAHKLVDSEAGALAAATSLGYPVVMKTAQPGIAHKTDVGGVHLGLDDVDAVRRAWRGLVTHLGPRVLVAAMRSPGVEVALGMVRDPSFGPIVTVAAGGVMIELLRDRRAALAPFGPATARRLLMSLALWPLFGGYRGAAAVDIDALAQIISRFSVLCAELADVVREIDVNPLICGREIAAVDALFVTD
ncbi:MAG: acetate--CoA ligase family protein [Burkholderiales bacterium]|nr:acetate--CoA ligase family protein [Burkholderiales bacterium]